MKTAPLDFKSVMAMRKAGQHEEALAGARALMQQDAKNIWNRRALAWCLVSCAWDAVKARRVDAAEPLVRQAAETTPDGDEMLGEAVGKLRNVLHDHTREILAKLKAISARMKDEGDGVAPESLAREAVDLLRQYAEIPGARAVSLSHSLVLLYAARTIANTPVFLPFARWWNLELLRPEDFERYRVQGLDRPLPSLCERVLKALHLSRSACGPEAAGHYEWMLEFFARNAARFPDNPWMAYYHGLLLADSGRFDSARSALTPFVKAHARDAWAWSALARACGDQPDLAAACLCRALECPTKGPEFLLRVRAALAHAWLKLGEPGAAAVEARTVLAVRNERNWSKPRDLEEIAAAGAPLPDDASYAALRARHARRAGDLVIPLTTPGIVSAVNRNKGIVVIALSADREALARADLVPGAGELRPGDSVMMSLAETADPLHPPHVVALKPSDDPLSAPFIKTVSGLFKAHPAGYGFVGEVFVPLDLAADLPDGRHVDGLALRCRKRRDDPALGWKMLKIAAEEAARS
jgi:hypothetical protein